MPSVGSSPVFGDGLCPALSSPLRWISTQVDGTVVCLQPLLAFLCRTQAAITEPVTTSTCSVFLRTKTLAKPVAHIASSTE